MTTIGWIVGYGPLIIVLTQIAITLAELAQGGGNGDQKRAEALAKIKEFEDRLGLKLPSVIQRYHDTLVGLLIDALVAVFNRTGFFAHSDAAA
jgi:hypothetical protein